MSETDLIRIGNQTAWFAANILDPFEYAVTSGFDAFEWFPDKKESGEGWSESDLVDETRLYIRDTAEVNDIRLSVHTPWQWSPFDTGSDETIDQTIRLASDIGAPLINIHYQHKRGSGAFAEALRPLIERLSSAGISLSVENTPETSPEDFNELFRSFRKSLGEDARIGMCLDLGHANLCSVTRNDYLRYVDLLDYGLPIIHIHLHENYGDRDSHIPVFTGPAGKDPSGIAAFISRMKKRKFSGSLILEQWPAPPRLLSEARDRLAALIGRPAEVETVGRMEIPGGDFAEVIAEADRKRKSWREKLSWIHDLIAVKTAALSDEQLAYLAVYLRFLGTGEASVSEDGSHYRPSHHAGMARDIFGRLSGMETADNAFVIRKIYPWLPSFAGQFLRAEPLTRIRDIAHRNDIPEDLKREIKTTLQNKLHRNAGPEDLATSEVLLEKITAPGTDYSPAFVEEFREFHAELKEFFNARSLEEQLHAIAGPSDGEEAILIERFLEARRSSEDPQAIVSLMKLLTELRNRLATMRVKETDTAVAQQLVMADIRLEDYAFVLLSGYLNHLSVAGKEILGEPAFSCLALTVENLRLSGLDPKECLAINSEIHAWSQGGINDREQFLRLKATVDRCRRLGDAYTQKILFLFAKKAERLGHLLGVAEHAIRVFGEADIRSHLVFQVSKFSSLLLREIKNAADLPPWDIIVPGRASGLLTSASNIEAAVSTSVAPAILLVEGIEGDEEIPPGVAGIIVPHETPHLSHLAVRARQAGIVFVACEDRENLSRIGDLQGRTVAITATGETVTIEVSPEGHGKKEARGQAIKSCQRVVARSSGSLLTLDKVTAENSGGKAYGARRLQELSRQPGSGFKTAEAVTLPFGVMERSLDSDKELGKEYRSLIRKLAEGRSGDYDSISAGMAEVIRRLVLPQAIVREVGNIFGDKSLMVRSSSNCEDLPGLSGAGIYHTEANICPAFIEDAVRMVWSSLWSKKALASRTGPGMQHDRARMAVLIQEMIVPDFSFVVHTQNPVSGKKDEAYVELAVGLGEALVSGRLPGSPYRLVCSKKTGKTKVLSFASFSHALRPGSSGGLTRDTVDYSEVRLSTDSVFRTALAERLASIAALVEKGLAGPQDIEGLISGEYVYLVQSRPQQGVGKI